MMKEYSGKSLPDAYVAFVATLETNTPYGFFYNTEDKRENEREKDAGIWCASSLVACTYSNTAKDCEYFKENAEIDEAYCESLTFKSEDTLSYEELKTCFAFGDVEGGFLIINMHDLSVWVVYVGDAFAAKLSASFEEFIARAVPQW